LAACPTHAQFRTLLLSATVTDETWWTLRTLFGNPDLEICASVSLRPEPDYYVVAAGGEAERIERIRELVAVLPRPFILYTTTRPDAEEWASRIRNDGLHRVALMTGATPATDREFTLRRWAAREVDVVVATSAFGLGMDQSDVRAVVHACVPETVDRFYQEVGRGGRDGRACLSFLVHTPGDLRIAERLSQDRIIGINKGLARWMSMYRDRIECEDDAILVPLDAKHERVQGDSDANVAWNLRTLVLMARSGMLRLQAHSPPRLEMQEGENDEDFARRCELAFREYARLARVKPANVDHLDRNTWASMVEASRQASRRADQEGHRQVLRLLGCHQSFATLFGEAYRVPDAGILPAQGISSCPASRRAGLTRPSCPPRGSAVAPLRVGQG
jgi:superfamily II DNA/RNA helicase